MQLKIKHRFDDKFLFIEALVVPEICSPLKAQNISVAQKEYDVISKLKLAVKHLKWEYSLESITITNLS